MSLLLSIWIILTIVFEIFLAVTLHQSDRTSHVKTAGFLGITLGWFLLSILILSGINWLVNS